MLHRVLRAVVSTAVVFGVVSARNAAPDAAPTGRIDALAKDVLSSGGAPGFAIAVLRDGAIVYSRGFGLRDVDRGLPVTAETPFAIGSISKGFTAAAVLALAHDGKLTLEDRLAKYEPHLPNAAAITVRELLNQTSGLHNYPNTIEHPWPLRGIIETRTIVEILATDKADFAPGIRWEYSNANYAALTAIVERVSGEPMGRFLSKRFFEPLGMARSGFGHAAQTRPGTALAYRKTAAPFEAQDEISADLFSGAGAVYADVTDMARWDAALLTGNVLTEAARAELFARGKLADGTPVDYGMGFVPAKLDGHRLVWHNGLAPGAGGYCYNALFPDDGLAIVVLSNGYDFEGRPERLVRQIVRGFF
jgi:CubicO group peptidase (beta-lactamase class C family)